jgi:hypothetical protein
MRSSFWMVFTVLALNAGGATASTPTADDKARAQAAVMEFSSRLRHVLQEQLHTEGSLSAIDVCHVQAPLIAQEVEQTHGVHLGRTSERLRNPANAPTEWQTEWLQQFAAKVAAGESAAAQQAMVNSRLPDGVALRLVRGIPVEPACTLCHGANVAAEVSTALANHYPDDNATGYKVGDLRGLIWVEVPEQTAP